MSLLRSLSKSNPRDPTQKFHPPPKAHAPRTEDDIKVQPQSVQDDQSIWPPDDSTPALLAKPPPTPNPHLHIEHLPTEVLEKIAGYLVGSLGAVSSSSSVVRNWNEHMRHPRQKNTSNLALVSRIWRGLIQERLYRHIKIQGTTIAVDECSDFFLSCPHLQRYVKHLQVISPIWEMKGGSNGKRNTSNASLIVFPRRDLSTWNPQPSPAAAFQAFQDPVTPSEREQNQFFQLASGNATIEEIFGTAKVLFPELSALTIEAGHCKRPPQMQYFRPRSSSQPFKIASVSDCMAEKQESSISEENPFHLPELPKVTALLIKGAWNVIRTPSDFDMLSQALPHLTEFSCGFHALKCQAYTTMNQIVRSHWPDNITHLSIAQDGLYTKANSGLRKWCKIYPESHICLELASRLPSLVSLTYTGRVCYQLFEKSRLALQARDHPANTNRTLKSVHLLVNNLCCDPHLRADWTGIHHLPFLDGFEQLIADAVASLAVFLHLHHLRIRYIDLDSPTPLLNPTFHLERGRAWGMWSEEIVAALQDYRPGVLFLGRKDFRGLLVDPDEWEEEGKVSVSVETYRRNADGRVLIH